ncbi:PREDICTED: uncharacterized protein LOC102253378 [Myotis brandtii]|uniref:uncharacterized protein LOC102253378 n=1 Tax=Myotis brandtii TaxID=109478 RepID=UPI00070403CC|nr:PREDICTED: uncharacterized protein LOC102253378 [Myotis brandtii]
MAVATTEEEPDVQSRCESQAGSSLRDEGLHLGPVDTGAHVGLSRAAPWPRASGSENMTTAQNGHGRVAAIPCSVSDPTDPGTVTYPACQNGGCGGDAEAQDSRPGPAKFVRLFSVSRKRTGAHPERPRSVVLMGHSSTWNALASFRKMGSFKKLKSSVFQGIQNREGSDAAKEEASEPDVGPALPNGAQSVGPCTGSALPSPTAQEAARKDSLEPKPGSQFTWEPEQPTPLRPTAPKPPSPQSPSGKDPNNLSALSLSSVDSNERAEGPVPFPDLVPATCDNGSEDSGSRSHPQLSLGEASGPEEKEEEEQADSADCPTITVILVNLLLTTFSGHLYLF